MWKQAFRIIIADTVSLYCEMQTSKLNFISEYKQRDIIAFNDTIYLYIFNSKLILELLIQVSPILERP